MNYTIRDFTAEQTFTWDTDTEDDTIIWSRFDLDQDEEWSDRMYEIITAFISCAREGESEELYGLAEVCGFEIL